MSILCGAPIFSRVDVPAIISSEVFAPAGGTSGFVRQHPTNEDIAFFHGQFGASVNIMRHDIIAGTNTDISVSTTNAIKTLAVNPSNDQEMYCAEDTTTNIFFTSDGGSNWATVTTASEINLATRLIALWSTPPKNNRLFISGDDGAATKDIEYTPNNAASFINVRTATGDDITQMVFTNGE